ncbi:MAG: excalibur calcium-binding domain-containing protein [Hamadaea sp.]|nr:excalibur calcium-binding domain-containing protein [Hamadaea sp.]
MWLYATLGGWVHSFLVTPVEVAPCGSLGTLYSGVPDGAYASCDHAIAAGAAPIIVGRPGYGLHLDRDRDGIACEWDE